MTTVQEIYETIDAFAPFASQESWDNSGLLAGAGTQPAEKILTTLDISQGVIAEAAAQGVQLIVSHHPVIFSPLKALPVQHPVYQLAAHQIAAICVHCSGSAASMLDLAAAQGCDALITGDIKHDRWYAAEFSDVALFDCGHYGTERFAAEILAAHIRAAHPEVTVIAQAGADPAEICAGGEEQ